MAGGLSLFGERTKPSTHVFMQDKSQGYFLGSNLRIMLVSVSVVCQVPSEMIFSTNWLLVNLDLAGLAVFSVCALSFG